MKKRKHVLGVLCSMILICGPAAIPDEPPDSRLLVLSRMGLMYVGGREIPMQGGGGRFGGGPQTQIVEQAPVHYLIPPEQKRKGKRPVVMVPGMGLTSYLYLGTPDGRDGWAQLFAKAGHPVFVFDEPNNAVSGFDVGRFNAVKQGEAEVGELPRFMLWANETAWRRWGIGPEPGTPFGDTRYPVAHIEQLYASMTPVYQGGGARGGGARGNAARPGAAAGSGPRGGRGGRFRRGLANLQNAQAPVGRRGGGGGGRRFGASVKAAALVELLEKIGPAVLIVHSASGGTGFEATRMRPDLVTAIVAVEVVGSPTDPDDIRKHFKDKQFIGLFGDHFDVRPMAGRHEACETTARLINEAGGEAEVIWLPKLGIRGNTHLMMQDTNNRELAGMILQRLSG
jgi:pimeloyl-ACP methyl ester carboxylesterase